VVFLLNTGILWLAIIFMYPKLRRWQKKYVLKPLKKKAHELLNTLTAHDPFVLPTEEVLVKVQSINSILLY
jgi:hypothetical protein